MVLSDVEERVPGKQGLKLSVIKIAKKNYRAVEERVPGKQGLKHFPDARYVGLEHRRRASSRKTRIETDRHAVRSH